MPDDNIWGLPRRDGSYARHGRPRQTAPAPAADDPEPDADDDPDADWELMQDEGRFPDWL